MKKLTILLFSILISFSSYGKWVDKGVNTFGDTFYINIDTIKEYNGYIYYWILTDYLVPIAQTGTMSNKGYTQGNCKTNGFKILTFIFYDQPMGEGAGKTYNLPNSEWRYPSSGISAADLLNYACNYVK